jgi:hypothetical protein
MKTIKKDGKIKRVSDASADKLVFMDGWQFCPKSEFKALKNTPEATSKNPSVKTPKKNKKKLTKV